MRRIPVGVLLLSLVVTAGFTLQEELQSALRGITADEIRAHLRFLSDDLLEGRAPGTRGGDLAGAYIASQFARAGLEPVGNGYLQPVPLVGIAVDSGSVSLEFRAEDGGIAAHYPADAVVWTRRPEESASVEGELVFAGYGVRAPEYGWDDFEGRDLEGKILMVLVNDPPAPPEEPALFGGRAMTYYGRWSYKLEEASRQGAAGALLVHTTAAAGYGWEVVRSSWTGELLSLPRERGEAARLALEGWLTRDFAARLLDAAGLSLDELFVRAARRDFRPVSTGIQVSARMESRVRRIETANVAGIVRGGHPERGDEVVVYTAHYDHLGIGPAVDGDSIYNGAYDNAGGVAALLEVAEAFTRLDAAPDRSILFLATSAEEAGLLGASYYVRNPLVPLDRTVAAINIDGANVWGATEDVVALGAGRSTLGRIVEARAPELGLEVSGDLAPEQGLFFRSDHFPFARAGVPALFLQHGLEYRGRPDGWGAAMRERYDAEQYHRPSDEYDPAFDLAGAVQQARLAFLVGYDVARAVTVPEWYDGSGFAAAREAGVHSDR